MMALRTAIAAVLIVTAAPLAALIQLPPCGVTESAMYVGYPHDLGTSGSGLILESYSNAQMTDANDVYVNRPAPVPELTDFYGIRVMNCATGQMFVARGANADDAVVALSATEFLRDAIRDERLVSYADARRAAVALYGSVIDLSETDETCGCSVYYPEMRPAGFTAFGDRSDVE
jgi:hypothetical protein